MNVMLVWFYISCKEEYFEAVRYLRIRYEKLNPRWSVNGDLTNTSLMGHYPNTFGMYVDGECVHSLTEESKRTGRQIELSKEIQPTLGIE